MDGRTKGSKYLEKLREEPQIDMNMPDTTGRKYVERLKLMANSGEGGVKSRGSGQLRTVYYLVGDERRAVRKFIELHPKYVKSCFSEEYNNPLQTKLPDELYWLMEQEYEIMEYNGEI